MQLEVQLRFEGLAMHVQVGFAGQTRNWRGAQLHGPQSMRQPWLPATLPPLPPPGALPCRRPCRGWWFMRSR